MASLVNSMKHSKKNQYQSSSNSSKKYKRGIISKHSLWGWYYPAPKPDKSTTKKKFFLQTNIPEEHRCKNSQQNIQQYIKRITYHYQVRFISEMQEWSNNCKSVNVIHYITKWRQKCYDHLNRCIKNIWQNSNTLIYDKNLKSLNKASIEETYLNIMAHMTSMQLTYSMLKILKLFL